MGDLALEEAIYGTETSVNCIGMMNVVTPFLSVLLVGIPGKARLQEKLGNAEALRAIDRCMKRIERAVNAFDGSIVKASGDELMAMFKTADASLQAAIEMSQRVSDLPPVSGIKLAIRVGIASGQAEDDTDPCSGETGKAAAELADQARAGQIIASNSTRNLISPTLLAHLGRVVTVRESETALEIVMLDAHHAATLQSNSIEHEANKPELTAIANNRLCLRYAGETFFLNDEKKSITLGRDSGCDLLIRDRRASRNHAVIEQRNNLIMLIDRSTNGTFVAINGMPEQFLRHSECVLHGKGKISFASPVTGPDSDCAEFELS